MKTSRSKGKQGENTTKAQEQIVTGTLPEYGTELDIELVTGVAPITLLAPTPENLAALELELLEAEQSLAHYQAKTEGLRKIIKNMLPRVVRK